MFEMNLLALDTSTFFIGKFILLFTCLQSYVDFRRCCYTY